MKFLITGGAGFIGSNFIRYWLKKYPKDKIINLDKLTYAGNLENLRDIQDNPNYKFVKGDICDGKLVEKLMEGVDILVNFAAESHVDRSILGPQVFIKTNIVGTQVLLDAALKNKVKRFHQISTDEVFGALPLDTKEKFNENSPFRPNSPYAASKAGADCLVRAYFKTYGLPVSITNCSNNYGSYQFPEKLIPLAITNLLEGKKVPIYGDGLYVRDWLFVEDHCRAIDLVLQSNEVGETYCVGGMTKDISNLEVVKKICKIMKKDFESSVEFVKDRPAHDRRYAVDWRKIHRQFGWEPKYDFNAWLEKTIKWYQKNKWWWKPLKERQKEYFKKQYGK
jgi:dTDP-glucose 4,6-dehydratase